MTYTDNKWPNGYHRAITTENFFYVKDEKIYVWWESIKKWELNRSDNGNAFNSLRTDLRHVDIKYLKLRGMVLFTENKHEAV